MSLPHLQRALTGVGHDDEEENGSDISATVSFTASESMGNEASSASSEPQFEPRLQELRGSNLRGDSAEREKVEMHENIPQLSQKSCGNSLSGGTFSNTYNNASVLIALESSAEDW